MFRRIWIEVIASFSIKPHQTIREASIKKRKIQNFNRKCRCISLKDSCRGKAGESVALYCRDEFVLNHTCRKELWRSDRYLCVFEKPRAVPSSSYFYLDNNTLKLSDTIAEKKNYVVKTSEYNKMSLLLPVSSNTFEQLLKCEK